MVDFSFYQSITLKNIDMATKDGVRETYYESAIRKGYNRRDFMKFAAFISAYMGLENSLIGQVANSLETKYRLPIIWEQ